MQDVMEKRGIKNIDFNCDLAQSFGIYKNNSEYNLLDYVSSVNIACGFHAGDPSAIKEALLAAKDRNVVVGAHIGYDDIQGFGYRPMDLEEDELEALVMYQVGALMTFAKAYHMEIEHVRPHGAMYRKAMEWVHEGKIGNIRCIKAGFCNLIPYNANDRLFRTDCGGGALLDLAVYPLTLVHNLLGVPESVRTYAHIQNGIDLSNTILLAYEDAFAAVESSFEYPSRNHAMISGSEGMILFGDMFHYANEVCRYDRSLHLVETYSQEDRINGYEYEIEEVMHCLRNGLQDSMLVPQRATLEVMRIMDECRKQWGMQFPDENLDDLKAFSDELQSRFAETQKSGDST